MNEMKVARKLGWFSLGLGAAELVAAGSIGRFLGIEHRSGLIRVFGLREIAAGAVTLSSENPTTGMWSRVAGDVIDLAALASGYTRENPKRDVLGAVIAGVAGITWLDYWCARRLQSGRPHGSLQRHRQNVAAGPSPRLPSGALPSVYA